MTILIYFLFSLVGFVNGYVFCTFISKSKASVAGSSVFSLVKGQLFIYEGVKHIVIHNDTTGMSIYAAQVSKEYPSSLIMMKEYIEVDENKTFTHDELEDNCTILGMCSKSLRKQINKLEH